MLSSLFKRAARPVAKPAPAVLPPHSTIEQPAQADVKYEYLEEGDELRGGDIYDMGDGRMWVISACQAAICDHKVPSYMMCYKPRRAITRLTTESVPV